MKAVVSMVLSALILLGAAFALFVVQSAQEERDEVARKMSRLPRLAQLEKRSASPSQTTGILDSRIRSVERAVTHRTGPARDGRETPLPDEPSDVREDTATVAPDDHDRVPVTPPTRTDVGWQRLRIEANSSWDKQVTRSLTRRDRLLANRFKIPERRDLDESRN